MIDLDSELRAIAEALLEGAPPPPPFPDVADARARTARRVRPLVYAAAAAIVVVGSVAIAVSRDNGRRTVASHADEPGGFAPSSYACQDDPGLDVTVPAATTGPEDGRAAGSRSLAHGQRALHWTTADGSVELRWPGQTQPVYADGQAVVSTLVVGESFSEGRAEIDVSPPNTTDAPPAFVPDVVVESRGPAVARPTAPCDLFELTVVTKDGLWHGGLRALATNGEFGQPAELTNLEPRIVERRSVDVAPTTAVRCQGSDQNGTPPNRSGGPDRSITGPNPADVLLGYLAANPTAPQSGYVEMTTPDGAVTYGVDVSRIGWTVLLFVARDGDGWFLNGWNTSGC